MSHWSASTWIGVSIAGVLALYGLHRLALSLEKSGRLYYLHSKPTGGGSIPFGVLQQIIEPKSQQVLVVRDLATHHELDRERGRGPKPEDDSSETGSASGP
jgi:hypothetical protein